jgi:hypothetical protein
MQLILAPVSVVAPPIGPHISSPAVYLSLLPLTFVHRLISPPVQAVTVLAASGKLPFERTAIRHFFPPVAVLHIVEPQPFVNLPVTVDVFSRAVGLVVVEVAHEDVAVRVVERSLPFGFPAHPHANVLCPVGPYLRSKTVLLLRFHVQLTAVDAPVTDLEVTDFLDPFHGLAVGRERRIVDNLFDEVEVLGIREGGRA